MFESDLSPTQQQEKYLEDAQDNGILDYTSLLIQENIDGSKKDQEEKAKVEEEDSEIGDLKTDL